MGLTMAQHRQAPSQFKEEPGHDSVSATFRTFSPTTKRKHEGENPRTPPPLAFTYHIHAPHGSSVCALLACIQSRHGSRWRPVTVSLGTTPGQQARATVADAWSWQYLHVQQISSFHVWLRSCRTMGQVPQKAIDPGFQCSRR
jgi:hypothetical protein